MSEATLRRKARSMGLTIRKARRYSPAEGLYGEFQLADAETGYPVFGFKYDADLNEIAAYLNEAA